MTYTMGDWLSLHELDLLICQNISERIKQIGPGFQSTTGQSSTGVTSRIPIERAWELVCEAYLARYQNQEAVLEIIASEVQVNLSSQSNARNFVIDQHGARYPEISLAYQGRPLDILALAHEFAHATQCVVTQDRFVAPALRELCAFSGELILLEYLLETDPSLYQDVAQHWTNFNDRYFGEYLAAFDAALLDIQTPYDNNWNYPAARFLSICSHQSGSSTCFWYHFDGRKSLKSVYESLFSCTAGYSGSLEQMIST